MIKEEFVNAVNSYAAIPGNETILWEEIETRYAEKSRHYHTMAHIENLILELIPVKASFSQWHVSVRRRLP